ncbi:MAG: deoxyribose-phosphate aldolase [Alphaproteobacteria bacterium]|nr:deoxyribose-phosphate aldolase [Alphaproteobacteria bacterium]
MSHTLTLSPRDLARMIDISAVQAFHTEADLRQLADVAIANGFIAVHALPNWTKTLAGMLKGSPEVLVGGPVGFPGGGHRTETKVLEARMMVADGVQEMDMMVNVGRLKSGELDYVTDEIAAVAEAAGSVPLKVILETGHLTPEEIRAGTKACIAGGATFVKTSTGWTPKGATLEDLAIIAETANGRIAIKASGGIRDLDTIAAMLKLGVTRFGINTLAARRILAACASSPEGMLAVEGVPDA